jgi:hypothetical protein
MRETMNRILALVGAATLAMTTAASATTMTVGDESVFNDGWATWIEYDPYASRGTADGRANPLNALGSNTSTFFEIGFGSTVTLQFGTQFVSPGTLVEVTFGNPARWPESVEIFVGNIGGTFTSIGSVSNAVAGGTGAQFTFSGGPFDALRLVDTTIPTASMGATGGWDIAAVRISPVPLPAGGLLLLTGLGVLALRRRNKQTVA